MKLDIPVYRTQPPSFISSAFFLRRSLMKGKSSLFMMFQ